MSFMHDFIKRGKAGVNSLMPRSSSNSNSSSSSTTISGFFTAAGVPANLQIFHGTEPSDLKVIRTLSVKQNGTYHVYLARYTRNDCNAANISVKTIKLTDIDYEGLLMVEHEVKVSFCLRHKNLLPFLYSFVSGDHLYNLTPYCDLGSAGELSKPTGLPEEAIALIVKDVLSGLEYLHNQGFIHRAVTGSHILATRPSGNCVLTGLKYSVNVTQDGRRHEVIHDFPIKAKENLNWFSPEMLEQNLLGYNFKTDMYSLGITCCELANGCIPFDDLQPTEMLLDKLTGNFPRPLDQTCTEIFDVNPDDLADDIKAKYMAYKNRRFSSDFHEFVVQLCLNYDPDKRPSATELLGHNFIKNIKKNATLLATLENNQMVPNGRHRDSAITQQPTNETHVTEDFEATRTNSIGTNWDF